MTQSFHLKGIELPFLRQQQMINSFYSLGF